VFIDWINYYTFRRCLPTRLIRSICSFTGLQPTLRVTSANVALNRCFLKLGTAAAYTGGRNRASSPSELLVINRSSHWASRRTYACSALALCYVTHYRLQHASTFLSVIGVTCINDHDKPGALALARARTHAHTHTHHTDLVNHRTSTTPQQLRARGLTLSVASCVSQNRLVLPVASTLHLLTPSPQCLTTLTLTIPNGVAGHFEARGEKSQWPPLTEITNITNFTIIYWDFF
jgi:hypothetical protein